MFPTVESCSSTDRENHTVVADMDGTLLISHSSFPYFTTLAMEVGGPIRLLLLLLATPLTALLYHCISEAAGIQVMFFAAFAGVKLKDIDRVAREVLPRLYAADLHPESWRVYSTCGRRCALTANARIMVEPFLKEYLGTDLVLGTEIAEWKGRATGFVKPPGVLVGENKAKALKKAFGNNQPEIGLGDRETDFPFMSMCKEGYIVAKNPKIKAVNIGKLLEGSRSKRIGCSAGGDHLPRTVSSSIFRIVRRIG